MSGTSLDGADGVLADFSGSGAQVLASATRAFDAGFRQELLALNSPSDNELHRGALAANQIAMVYADVVADLLLQARQRNIEKIRMARRFVTSPATTWRLVIRCS